MKILNRYKTVLSVMLVSITLLLSVMFLGVTNLFAQQTSEQSSESNSATKQAAETKTSKSNERVFKPSEEISEDSPVPFPVDI